MRQSEATLSGVLVAPDILDERTAKWHAGRHRRILERHPEVKRLFGVDQWTAAWVVGLGAAQIGIAIALRKQPTWVVLASAYVVGAFIAHALGVLIHECAHNLVFHATWKNKLLSLVANVPLGAPGAMEFRHQHLLHHRHLGDTREPDGLDTQSPTRREVVAVGNSSTLKILSFTFGRFVYKARPANRIPRDAWLIANIVSCIAVDAALTYAFGVKALAFIMFSLLFGFGPHVLGARRIAEHLTLRRGQPTNSYYGALNHVSFGVGFHVEHHDFPYVPWRRLSRLHALARESYDSLASVPSWSRLIADHFFDERRNVAQYVGLSNDFVEELEHEEPQSLQPPLPGGR